MKYLIVLIGMIMIKTSLLSRAVLGHPPIKKGALGGRPVMVSKDMDGKVFARPYDSVLNTNVNRELDPLRWELPWFYNAHHKWGKRKNI